MIKTMQKQLEPLSKLNFDVGNFRNSMMKNRICMINSSSIKMGMSLSRWVSLVGQSLIPNCDCGAFNRISTRKTISIVTENIILK